MERVTCSNPAIGARARPEKPAARPTATTQAAYTPPTPRDAAPATIVRDTCSSPAIRAWPTSHPSKLSSALSHRHHCHRSLSSREPRKRLPTPGNPPGNRTVPIPYPATDHTIQNERHNRPEKVTKTIHIQMNTNTQMKLVISPAKYGQIRRSRST